DLDRQAFHEDVHRGYHARKKTERELDEKERHHQRSSELEAQGKDAARCGYKIIKEAAAKCCGPERELFEAGIDAPDHDMVRIMMPSMYRNCSRTDA
ncbi:MAG: hypothetical protein H6Q55_3075, partial [Deltaproteobacteria bacterium]|nr:hypothetical protein [Deltaproteobacteria bacterium]